MRKGVLTLKQMDKIWKESTVFSEVSEDMIIKWWQYPFLWMLYSINGRVIISDNWKMYYVDFKSVRYLLKSEEIKPHKGLGGK